MPCCHILINMTESAHTFHPTEDTYEYRMGAYKQALDAYRNLETGTGMTLDEEWADRLGTPQELIDAEKILTNSLKMASKSVTKDDMHKAKTTGWLDEEDLQLIARIEREQEMKSLREDKKEQQDSLTNKFKL